MTKKICIHCFVSGKVQGVWFRASTKTEADKLGLVGWVKNLSDGRVEVLACGEANQIDKLTAWLKHGPSTAEVKDLSIEKVTLSEDKTFEVR